MPPSQGFLPQVFSPIANATMKIWCVCIELRYAASAKRDDGLLCAEIERLASRKGWYGYRRIAARLRHDGF
jgi:hypothetical protein